MVATTAVSAEEYLHTCYEPDMEYVNGQLVERNVGGYFHGFLQGLMAAELLRRAGRRFRVFLETRVRISAEPRYRIPDICVKALPHRADPIIEKPDLVIEILSPDDRPADVLKKIADYLQAGIPHIWIVDPYQRTVMEADAAGFREATEFTLETESVGPSTSAIFSPTWTKSRTSKLLTTVFPIRADRFSWNTGVNIVSPLHSL